MSQHTNKTYKFSTFQEMVDIVPSNRLRDCMDEMCDMLFSGKTMMELTYQVASEIAKKDGKELPPMPERLIELPPFLEWIDDGKRIRGAVLDFGDEKLSIKMFPEETACSSAEAAK